MGQEAAAESEGMTQETELKLELDPEAAEALRASGVLPGDPAIARQRSVYFDTPRHDLSAAGVSLRIRQSNGRRVQTVKSAGTGAAGLFARPEWERPVEDDTPVLDGETPVPALLGKKARELASVFEVRVERRTWNVSPDGAAIEVVLDIGEVAVGERSATVCEVELELKRGTPDALFSFARTIGAAVPVRLGVVTKAERGFNLIGPAVRSVKAGPVELAPDMSAAKAFRHIAGACLRHFRLNEALVGQRNDEALHQARVALRRLRSALSIFREIVADGRCEHLRGEVRWLAGELAAARNLDVLGARCDTEEARAKLRRARAEAYRAAESALALERSRTLMLDLSEWIAVGEWTLRPDEGGLRGQPAAGFARLALDRLCRKVRKGGRDLGGLDDEARHELRKDAKKLRYAVEFFSSLFDGGRRDDRYRRFVKALAALQDRLGELNDVAVAPEILSRIGLDSDDAFQMLLHDGKGRRKLLAAAAKAYDAFADARRCW